MNNRGQVFGFALLVLFFLLVIAAFITIEPFKEILDDVRGDPALNCKGTPNFNQTDFDLDNDNIFEKLNKRTTCFATGLTMVWFIGAFLLAAVTWLFENFRRRPK